MAADCYPDIKTVIVKLASRCNLSCRYCYLYQHEDQGFRGRPRFMGEQVFESLLAFAEQASAANSTGTVDLVLHGGEPTLMPVDRVAAYLRRAAEVLGPRLRKVSMQTNGTLVDDTWARLLVQWGVEVGVSIDGPEAVHDRERVDFAGRGSLRRVVDGIRRLQGCGLDVGTLTVVNPAADGLETFEFLLSLGIRHLNFLLPDVSHDHVRDWYGEYGPRPIARYLIPVFDRWFALDDPGIVVGVCWDMVERLLGGPGITDVFGNRVLKYVVVETDGTVESLDALKVGQAGLADTGLNVVRDGFSALFENRTLAGLALTTGFPMVDSCQECHLAGPCGGGYLPHRFSSANGFANPSVWCEDIIELFDHVEQAIAARDQAS